MSSGSIAIDGHIDLVPRVPQQPATEADQRRRQSRLNDVMIVIERDQAALETALLRRLSAGAFGSEIGALALVVDDAAPTYHVTITPQPGAPPNACPNAVQRRALETAIATEIFEAIERHAGSAQPRNWRAEVSATVRSSQSPAKRAGPAAPHRQQTLQPAAPALEAHRSRGLRALLTLLAVVIAAAIYLYANPPMR